MKNILKAYLQAIINLDICIKGGTEKKIVRTKQFNLFLWTDDL